MSYAGFETSAAATTTTVTKAIFVQKQTHLGGRSIDVPAFNPQIKSSLTLLIRVTCPYAGCNLVLGSAVS